MNGVTMTLRGMLASALLAAVALMGGGTALAAAPWPSRPVTFILPSAAGGAPDIIARLLCERLSIELGQNFIVQNRPGANQAIGMNLGAKAPKDGYTFVFASTSGLS